MILIYNLERAIIYFKINKLKWLNFCLYLKETDVDSNEAAFSPKKEKHC